MRIATALCIAILPGAAIAADLGTAPPIARSFDWTGVYVGVNGGYGSAAGSAEITAPSGIPALSTTGINGGLAGGQAGANWQTGALVVGVEGDYQWSGMSKDFAFGCGFACTVNERIGITSFGTLRGRVGAAFDRVLVYGTAGGAWLTARDEASFTLGGATTQLGKVNLSGLGWTAGAGLEVAVAQGWSLKSEYLYLASSRLSGSGPVLGLGTVSITATPHAHIGRLGLNYRF